MLNLFGQKQLEVRLIQMKAFWFAFTEQFQPNLQMNTVLNENNVNTNTVELSWIELSYPVSKSFSSKLWFGVTKIQKLLLFLAAVLFSLEIPTSLFTWVLNKMIWCMHQAFDQNKPLWHAQSCLIFQKY